MKLKETNFFILFFLVLLMRINVNAQEKILHFQHLDVSNGLSQNTIHGIVQDKYGFMWFGTWAGLCRYDGYNFNIYRSDSDNPKTISNNRIHYLIKDKEENIWLTSFDSIYYCRYNYETDDFVRILRKEVPQYIRDSLNRRVVSSRWRVRFNNLLWEVNQYTNNFYQINLQNNVKTEYLPDPFNKWAINDDYATDLYIDNSQVLWVGTFSGGVNKSSIINSPFNYFFHSPFNSKSIGDNNIRGLAEDNNGNVWIGSRSNGITVYNPQNNTYKFYKNNPLNSNSIFGNQIRNIYCDKYNQIWIGAKEGLTRYDPNSNSFFHYDSSSTQRYIAHNWVYAMTEDRNGNLWIGTWNGIGKYNRKADSFEMLNPSLTLYPYIRVFLEDRKYHYLWVATEGGGLTKIFRDSARTSKEKYRVKHFINIPSNSNSLINDRIYTMVEDYDHNLWIGTGGGLCRFNIESEKFDRFTVKEGLPDEMILGILCDNNGDIWLSHKRGLSRINSGTLKIENYYLEDGLQGNEFNENACLKTRTGELYFGGLNGLNSFHPDSFKINPIPPKIVFTNLFLFNKPVLVNQKYNGRVILNKVINLTDKIILKNADKSFSIEFAALHYLNPKGNSYKYMLEGFDTEWIYTDASKRIANYTNLKPGKYIFMVNGSNCNGVWATKNKELLIIIKPAWYVTWWFRATIILLLGIIILFIYRLRVSIYQKKEKELSVQVDERTGELKVINDILLDRQKIIQEQTQRLKETNQQLSVLNSTKDKIFSIIAHDLRNPFHTVLGFSELLLASYEKLSDEKIQRYIQLINSSASAGNSLLENLLQWSRAQTGRITFEPVVVDIENLISDTLNFLQITLQRKKITIKQDLEHGMFVFGDINMLQTILRNLISNAIKFSYENGTITIKVKPIEMGTEISVSDQGVGISDENKSKLFGIHTNVSTPGTNKETGTGLGLVICKEFVEKHGGTIWIESEPGKGATFKFTLPKDV